MVFSVTLTGCGKTEDKTEGTDTKVTPAATTETTEPTEKPAETIQAAKKIIVFQSKVEISDQLEACAIAYQEETGVEVEVWGTTGDDYLQQLKMKLGNNLGVAAGAVKM